MGKKRLDLVLCLLFISFSSISVTAQSSVISQTCDETAGNFEPNSSYGKNLRLMPITLISSVPNHEGYFDAAIGNDDQDQVFIMGMCGPGARKGACSSCIQNASDSLLRFCPNQTDAFSWFGENILCLVRYSSKSFSGASVLEPYRVLFNRYDVNREDQKEFDSVWDGLMNRTITSLVTKNPSNFSLSSSNYYAKDTSKVPVYGNISTLMQCTPDVSARDCLLCLQKSVDYYKTKFHGKKGSIIMRPSCFFRWELYPFSAAFDGLIILPSPSLPPSQSPSLPPSPPKSSSLSNPSNIPKKDTRFSGGIIAAIIIAIFVFLVLSVIAVATFKRREKKQEIDLPTEAVQFDLKTIEAATSNFSERNRLGKGGFGEVYKGILMNETEIAVKRLSKTSGQGEIEFKNEVVVVAKLQHRNLVKLLGFSLEREEKLLVYEFVHNKSLDYFLFDPTKRIQLNWTVRRNIIWGITRGILYLHQDSRLKIIHRDLKASNILLDADMNPKIADFGMARIVGINQSEANTAKVVGTIGYMPPEYVANGQFSTKSDVYSFGVLILEIISGKKTNSFYQTDGLVNNLVTYVWRLWENKSLSELIDPEISEDCESDEVTRYIHIGLLCVQENPVDRPTMSTIHQMLTTNSIALPVPLQPGFFFRNEPQPKPLAKGSEAGHSGCKSITCSVDEATITDVNPR